MSTEGPVDRVGLPGSGLAWPRGRDGRHLSAEERGRLLHYERLMGMAHLAAIPLALVGALVHLDVVSISSSGAFAGILAVTLTFALVYHFALPRAWCSHTKVVLGLVVDVGLVTAVVSLTGHHMSLLVFLYYLVVIAGALTLESAAMYAICALITLAFGAQLFFDPLLLHAPSVHAGHLVLFLVSLWVVAVISDAAASQIKAGERRLLASMRTQHEVALQNARLSADLAEQLQASRALTVSLQRQREETQRLADMVIRAQEEERHRVARELHDEANQTLAALLTGVDAAEQLSGRHHDPELEALLRRLRRLASASLGDLQRIATELRPPALDEFGLLPALTRHVRERTEATALRADVVIEGRRRRLPPAVEVALYRIAQEALANAQKHSEAHTVHVRLRFLPGFVRLDVSDDGCGLDGDASDGGRTGLGLAGMRERATIVGGSLDLSSRPSGGTRVSACIPVPVDDAVRAAVG